MRLIKRIMGYLTDYTKLRKNKVVLLILIIAIIYRGGLKNIEGMVSDDIILLPSLSEAPCEQGFTCTGLAFDAVEKCFYIGNIGKRRFDSKENIHSTIVVLDKNFSFIVKQIDIGNIFPEMGDVQGLTIDSSDDTIWFCSFQENMVRHIDKKGKDLGGLEIKNPTGIAYDSRFDHIWVLTYSELLCMEKNGKVKKSIPVSIEGQDQIWIDENNLRVLMTGGINYQGENYVYSIDLNSGEIKKLYTLLDSYAIEGIAVDSGNMYIANDGVYHKAKVEANQINIYQCGKEFFCGNCEE